MNLEEIITCPITREVIVEPVILADGHTYEKSMIVRWLEASSTSPMTNLPLANRNFVENRMVKNIVEAYNGSLIEDKLKLKEQNERMATKKLVTFYLLVLAFTSLFICYRMPSPFKHSVVDIPDDRVKEEIPISQDSISPFKHSVVDIPDDRVKEEIPISQDSISPFKHSVVDIPDDRVKEEIPISQDSISPFKHSVVDIPDDRVKEEIPISQGSISPFKHSVVDIPDDRVKEEIPISQGSIICENWKAAYGDGEKSWDFISFPGLKTFFETHPCARFAS